ncbi:MAG: DCC1-like thiol-disulfide oxidoreductase family protein [Rhodoluna sp.]
MSVNQVLIYDGDCKFCQLSLEFGIRQLKTFPKYVAFQKIDPTKFGLTIDQVRTQIWLVDQGSGSTKPKGGHLAAGQILTMQRNLFYKALGWLIKTPPTSFLADVVYRWVAKNRHRLPGGSRQCKLEDNYFEN